MLAEGHSLRKNIVYSVLGNGVLHICRFAVLVLLAKFATREVLGSYSYAGIALSAPVVLFCGLELRAAFVADAAGQFSFGVYRTLRVLGMCVAGLILTIAVIWITRTDTQAALVWLMLAVCAGRIVYHSAEIYWGVYQRRERLDLMAWSNALRGVTILAPFALLVFFSQSAHGEASAPDTRHLTRLVAWAVSIHVIAWVGIWWFFDRALVVRQPSVDLSWTWSQVWRVAKQALPLGLVFLLINLCETVIHWFIKRAGGGEGWADLGYFGAMRYITLGATFLIVQVSTAAGNRLANYYQRDLRAFLRLAGKLTAVAFVVGAGFVLATWLFGKWFLGAVYTPEYAKHYREFLILVSAQAIVLFAAVFGFVTTHMRQFWIQVPVQLAVLVATATAAAFLVRPENPVLGGAQTTLVRSITQVVLYLGCVLLGLRWRDRILVR